jgi:capsular exopolysaccharide synthesis family protein
MELLAYIRPLRKWWWLVVSATLVAAIASALAVRQQPPRYQARATLIIGRAMNNPNPTGADFTLGQQLAQTYAEIARREPVRTATMSALGLTWLPEYSARALPNSQLMELIVVDTSPERAQVVANELVNQLILQSPTSTAEEAERQAFVNAELDDLENKIVETRTEISARQDELGEQVSAGAIAETQAQLAALQSKLTTLQTSYATLLTNSNRGALNQLTVIESAGLPRRPIGPNKVATVALASLIGLVLAIGAAYLLEYLDDTIKTPDDVQELTGLPTLAGIARIKGEAQNRLPAMSQPRSPVAEAFRVLRTAIQFSSVDRPSRTLLITSPSPSEGKSTIAANLAVVIAQAGHNVLLVDADLRRPTQQSIFSLSDRHGLTDLLLELNGNSQNGEGSAALLNSRLQPTAVEGLRLLSCGARPPNPSELLGSTKMRRLLAALASQFDVVIVDSPPILAVTDAVVLSAVVDGVVLVIDADETRRGPLQQAVSRLREANAHITGVVLNRLSLKSEGYRYYYSAESARYYTGEDGGEEKAPVSANGNGKARKGLIGRQRTREVAAESE